MDNKYYDQLTGMLNQMKEKDASDLHLSVGIKPFIRINGKISTLDTEVLSKEECENILFSVLTEEGKEAFYKIKTLDFSFGTQELGRFRFNIYQQRGSIAAAIRRLPNTIPSLEELKLPVKQIKSFCSLAHGLVLICGPVGTGKTTTLASTIDYINRTRSCHIITIEDPIEYVHQNIKSLIHQREVRRDTPNFVDALKYILREDPDIVVIGEMRDPETILAALTIAETGHLVFATLHTGDTSESIRRIVDAFPVAQQKQITSQLSYILKGVMNQVLIPMVDESSRIIATEVMLITPAIANLIRENKVEQIYTLVQLGTDVGMQTMNQSLYWLASNKFITKEAALSKSSRVNELIKLME